MHRLNTESKNTTSIRCNEFSRMWLLVKNSQRVAGLLLTIATVIGMYLIRAYPLESLPTDSLLILLSYLLTVFLPGLLIDLIFGMLGSGDSFADKCGGLRNGGYLIGYTERSLLFLAMMITHYDEAMSFPSLLSFLSVIVAAKAIFRYSSRETDDRACADWYILGTLMSITMALAISWLAFRFLLVGG